MSTFLAVKYLHIATVAISISLFVLRYWWQYRDSPLRLQRWVRIAPHLNDTILLLTGVVLVIWTRYYPFTAHGAWLTEKLFGVIIYIVLGFIAPGKGKRRQQPRWFAFVLALVVLYIILKLAITQIPLLG